MTRGEYRACLRRLEQLQDQMTDLLVEMELRSGRDTKEAFDTWWDTEGNMRRYFDMKAETERIGQRLHYAELLGELPEDTGEVAMRPRK